MNATEKQLAFIKDIEKYVDEKFAGKTVEQASRYIRRNKERYFQNKRIWMRFLSK